MLNADNSIIKLKHQTKETMFNAVNSIIKLKQQTKETVLNGDNRLSRHAILPAAQTST